MQLEGNIPEDGSFTCDTVYPSSELYGTRQKGYQTDY